MKYREQLPNGCPPKTARDVCEAEIVYRLIRTNPPSEDDFQSQRWEKPTQKFPKEISECQARGLSVFLQIKDCQKAQKLPSLRERLVCSVQLSSGTGKIQKTGSSSHHTWWPYAQFKVLEMCSMT